ncbi:hypothetical protein SPYCA_1133 [Sphingopyxis sp. FD7]|nr:hypothetical protein SPYCA_1133 [Sphingopyxis sp. FD7]
MTPSIDEDQRTFGAKTSKIEQIDAGRADKARRVRLTECCAQRWQFVQRVAKLNVAAVGKIAYRHSRQRNTRFQIGARNT